MQPAPDITPLLDLGARVVFFPVRHHSPACARVLREVARRVRPAAVLVEGPSDFNPHLDELYLPHQLPVAVYSYVRLSDERRRGAYYPFCEYTPEWQALQAAQELGAAASFIDLPWAEMAALEQVSHRYADPQLRRSPYVETLCRQLGVDDFDALWDALAEQDPELSVEEYLERFHSFCVHARLLDENDRTVDRQSEAFMADRVREAAAGEGAVLVVTGGFHSYALYARVHGLEFEAEHGDDHVHGDVHEHEHDHDHGDEDDHDHDHDHDHDYDHEIGDRGISLTPYSYGHLDRLRGYNAGMPSPGFYDQVWRDRQRGRALDHRGLLMAVARTLREHGQMASSADLIAVETMALGLASMRGHPQVWRADILDAITGALVKEELDLGCGHPMLDAVLQVFRGDRRGVLAEGTRLPPLYHDVERVLRQHELTPQVGPREVELDLHEKKDLSCSRVLRQLVGLQIDGFALIQGNDMAARDDLAEVRERWQLRWSPEFDATCIKAAIYGPNLADAALARLLERAQEIERDAEAAALLLLEASLMGLAPLALDLHRQLSLIVAVDGSFFSVTGAVDHLLYLYRYDAVLGTSGQATVGALLAEAFARGLWLLEGLGTAPGLEEDLLRGVRVLLETFERCGADLALDRVGLVGVLQRVSVDPGQGATGRGAAVGALWALGEADMTAVQDGMQLFADPDQLGDFLAGLFCLARETAQRHPELVMGLDGLMMAFDEEEFLHALPSLRMAFTYFTPREKHHLAATLMQALGLADAAPLAALEVPVATAARVHAFEGQLARTLAKYGLRGGER